MQSNIHLKDDIYKRLQLKCDENEYNIEELANELLADALDWSDKEDKVFEARTREALNRVW